MGRMHQLRSVAAGLLLAGSALALDDCEKLIQAFLLVIVVVIIVGAVLLFIQLVLFGLSVFYLVRNKNKPTVQSRTRGIVVGSMSSAMSALGVVGALQGVAGGGSDPTLPALGLIVGALMFAVSVACVVVSAQSKPAPSEAAPGGAPSPQWPTAPGPAGVGPWPGQQPPTAPVQPQPARPSPAEPAASPVAPPAPSPEQPKPGGDPTS